MNAHVGSKKFILTKEGLEHLRTEYEKLTKVIRPQITQRIQRAREFGDLAENSEYDAAKEAQATNEGRIAEVKDILENAVIIESTDGSGVVRVGSSVKVESKNGVQTFVIVGAAESDPA